MLVTLRQTSTPAISPATGYVVTWEQYDVATRHVVPGATASTTPQTFELAADALVQAFCVGTTRREVRYNGNGGVYTQDVENAIQCAGSLSHLTTSWAIAPSIGGEPVGRVSDSDAVITVRYICASGGDVLVRVGLMEGAREGVEQFSQSLVNTAPASPAPVTIQFPPPAETLVYGSGPDFRGPYREVVFAERGFGPGRYRVQITELATQQTLEQEMLIDYQLSLGGGVKRMFLAYLAYPGNDSFTNGPLTISRANGGPDNSFLFAIIPAGRILLNLNITGTSNGKAIFSAAYWNTATQQREAAIISNTGYDLNTAGLNALDYRLPAGWPVGTSGANTIVSDGRGGVHSLAPVAPRRPRLANLIVTQPCRPGDATGALLVEVDMQMDPDCPPLEFKLYDFTGDAIQTNNTGHFDGLIAGDYRYSVTAPTAYNVVLPLSAAVTLRARYGLRYYLNFQDSRQGLGRACRLELLLADYTGDPEKICGQDEAVAIDWQGVQAGPLQADMPPSVGALADIKLFGVSGQFADFFIGDRTCLVDIYYNDQHRFRGFVRPDQYSVPLLGGNLPVSMVATCGLGDLKTTAFSGGLSATTGGQELRGRWSLLQTVLHILSRTDTALDLADYTNRRALEMTTDEVMLAAGYTERLAYLEQDCRTVLDACMQALGGTIFQRDGVWQIRSINESNDGAAGRRFGPGGTLLADGLSTPAPAAVIVPGSSNPADITHLGKQSYWLDGSQRYERRAGWKRLTATGDAGFVKNVFRQGSFFSLAQAWTANGNAMQPQAGWAARRPSVTAPDGLFPLALAEATGKASEYGASLPLPREDYLESEYLPIAAGREGLIMRLSIAARFVALYRRLSASSTALMLVEVVGEHPDTGAIMAVGHTFSFAQSTGADDGLTTVTRDIPFGLAAGLVRPRLRIYPFELSPVARAPIGQTTPPAALLLGEIGFELLPQGAEWQATDAYTALGPGGTLVPSEKLEVFHTDIPAEAGLFDGNAAAFQRAITRGPVGNTSAWARPRDLKPAPLLACQVLDALALRTAPTGLLIGRLGFRGADNPEPVQLLDAVDSPYDPPFNGKRGAVISCRWDLKKASTTVVIAETGRGQYLGDVVYQYPENALLREGELTQVDDYLFPAYWADENGRAIILE